jgi:hypothetical protein
LRSCGKSTLRCVVSGSPLPRAPLLARPATTAHPHAPAAQHPSWLTQLEHKYQHDLEESRRGAEALASQCAAQSSLIATLKREVAQSAAVLKDQKVIVQRVEAKSAADLELAQRDIEHLHTRIVELSEEKRASAALAVAVNVQVADLQAAAARAAAGASASEGARAATLDAYARQLLASRYLLKKWRAELALRQSAQQQFDRVSVCRGGGGGTGARTGC